MLALLRRLFVSTGRTISWFAFSRLALLVPFALGAQSNRPSTAGAPVSSGLPIIDMHFHTMWDGPDLKEPLTGFVSPKTPDELRRLNIAALNRYHIVKVVASGDQLDSYEQELGPRLIPGILLPTDIYLVLSNRAKTSVSRRHRFGRCIRKVSSQALRSLLLSTRVSNLLRPNWNNIGLSLKNSISLSVFTWDLGRREPRTLASQSIECGSAIRYSWRTCSSVIRNCGCTSVTLDGRL